MRPRRLRAAMKGRVAPAIGRREDSPLGHKPTRELLGAFVIGERGLLAIAAFGVQIAGREHRLAFGQIACLEQFLEVLRQELFSALGHWKDTSR